MPNSDASPGRPARGQQLLWLSFEGPRSLRSPHLRRAIHRGRIGGLVFASRAFEQALSRGEFDGLIRDLAATGEPAEAIHQSLLVESVRQAADLISVLHVTATGRHGHVSAAISPELCYDTEALIEEAENLWAAVRRPNPMIQIPATHEALAAAGQLLRRAISVNLTHVTGFNRHREIAAIYDAALAARDTSDLSVSGICCAVTLEPYVETAWSYAEKGKITGQSRG